MARKIKQNGGIVGIVELIRTTKEPDGTFSYPSLIEYLNFLEMNYSDTYYKIGTKLHSAFYANVSLNDVKELLETLNYMFNRLCMRLLKEIQSKPFYKRDENDMAMFNRINDIFMNSLSNVEKFRDDMKNIADSINIAKSKATQPISDDELMNQTFIILEGSIRGNKTSGGGLESSKPIIPKSVFNTDVCSPVEGTSLNYCSSSGLAKVVVLAKYADPQIVDKIVGVLEGVGSKAIGVVSNVASGIGSVVSAVSNLFGGSRKKRRYSRKSSRKRISKRHRVSNKKT